MAYKFEEKQSFKVKVFDVDDFDKKDKLEMHKLIGEYEFFLHEVVTARN